MLGAKKFNIGDKLYVVNYRWWEVCLEKCKVTNVFWSEKKGFSYKIQKGPLLTDAEEKDLFYSVEDFAEYFDEEKKSIYTNKIINEVDKEIQKNFYYMNEYKQNIEVLEKRKNKFLTNQINIKL